METTMKTSTAMKHLVLTLACLLPLSAGAADPECHALMTEKECRDHQVQLATLAPGKDRDQYLLAFYSTREERQALCSCGTLTGSSRSRPQRQALLEY